MVSGIMIKLNKIQRENLGKFFIDIAKAFVIGYVITGIFGKTTPVDFLLAVLFAILSLLTGLILLKEG
jgi:UDP-N-acetylmuramyl pentapeptide synthase